MPKSKREKLYLALILVVLVGIIVVLAVSLSGRRDKPEAVQTLASETMKEPEVRVVTREVEKLVEVEKQIGADVIQDGLRDMGVLITEEYYFTEVVSFSSVKKLFKTDISLKFTETNYLASYDGVVTAGLDFGAITVEKDEEKHRIRVQLPASEIRNIDIDPESFTLYSERSGLGNPLSAADFNTSLVELEELARSKAVERGVLERADEHARALISNFIGGLVDLSDYSLDIVSK